MDEIDRSIVNALQDGLPLTPRPFATLAGELDIAEEDIVARIGQLLDANVLTRFGPLFNADRLGGGLSLCALSAPEHAFEAVAEKVNAHPEVAHNYERDHALNMWFVLATEEPEQIERVVEQIESETGCDVFQFPKEKEFFVGLKLEI